MEVSKTLYDLAFNILVSLIIAPILSFAMLAINVGFVSGFFTMWLKSIFTSIIFAVPATYMAIAVVSRFLDRKLTIKQQDET